LAAAKVCWYHANTRCLRADCPYDHPTEDAPLDDGALGERLRSDDAPVDGADNADGGGDGRHQRASAAGREDRQRGQKRRKSKTICKYFLKKGGCLRGEDCNYTHALDDDAAPRPSKRATKSPHRAPEGAEEVEEVADEAENDDAPASDRSAEDVGDEDNEGDGDGNGEAEDIIEALALDVDSNGGDADETKCQRAAEHLAGKFGLDQMSTWRLSDIFAQRRALEAPPPFVSDVRQVAKHLARASDPSAMLMERSLDWLDGHIESPRNAPQPGSFLKPEVKRDALERRALELRAKGSQRAKATPKVRARAKVTQRLATTGGDKGPGPAGMPPPPWRQPAVVDCD